MHISVSSIIENSLCYYGTLSFMNCFKENENWLIFFKSNDRKDFLALGSNWKTLLGPREAVLYHIGTGDGK